DGDAPELVSYVLSKRLAKRLATEDEAEGDFEWESHPDICQLLREKDEEIYKLRAKLVRGGMILAEQLDTVDGVTNPEYPEQRDAVRWIVENTPSVAELYGFKP